MEEFDLDTGDKDKRTNPDQLRVNWALDRFVGRKAHNAIDPAEFIYNRLFELGFWKTVAEDNSYVWNDLDDAAWVIPHDTNKVFAVTSQNRNYLFILEQCKYGTGRRVLHIRRFWDELDLEDLDYDLEVMEEGKNPIDYVRLGLKHAERYSDHIHGKNPYDHLDRPDLAYFEQRSFDPKYKDGRDNGYVLTIRESREDDTDMPAVEHAHCYLPTINNAMFHFDCLYDEMSEDNPESM